MFFLYDFGHLYCIYIRSNEEWVITSGKLFLRFAHISGLIAPLFFIPLIILLGEFEEGYNHISDTISALGGVNGPRKAIFQIGAIWTGVLIIIFGVGLHRSITGGKGSKTGPILVILSGIGLIGTASFLHHNIGNPELVNKNDISRILHLAFASISVAGSGISPFFLAIRFRKDPIFVNYSVFTLITGILANIPSIVLSLLLITSSGLVFKGILEKLAVLFPLLWLLIISIRLLNIKIA